MIIPPMKFSNFRSMVEPVHLPFSKKVTFVVGQNNAGKSSLLRLLSILCNREFGVIDDIYDFDGGDKTVQVILVANPDRVRHKLRERPHALRAYERSGSQPISLRFSISKNGALASAESFGNLDAAFPGYFGVADYFLQDFSISSDDNSNRRRLAETISPIDDLPGTVYLPNVRFITPSGQQVPRFSKTDVPGPTINFGSVIDELAAMDRPSFENRHLKERLRDIGKFMAHCLECSNVTVEVPDGRRTIHLTVDGEERPIASWGTGIEQLLMIGLAAIGFGEKLVLIDEPELHLHPRSQRLILRYIERIDANFLIATHSAPILDAVDADIVHLSRAGGQTKSRTITTSRDRYDAVRDLGYAASDLVQTRFAIWVEGPSDRIYLNWWLKRLDKSLREGIDYSVLFYGGSILARHSFEDYEGENDNSSALVHALSISRAFAVVIDSDQHPSKPTLKAFKTRVREEVNAAGGICWITEGREIENYIAPETLKQLQLEFSYLTIPANTTDQVLDRDRADKVRVANRVVEVGGDDWPLDLRQNAENLVRAILAQRS